MPAGERISGGVWAGFEPGASRALGAPLAVRARRRQCPDTAQENEIFTAAAATDMAGAAHNTPSPTRHIADPDHIYG
jgi:hypothetical protein